MGFLLVGPSVLPPSPVLYNVGNELGMSESLWS